MATNTWSEPCNTHVTWVSSITLNDYVMQLHILTLSPFPIPTAATSTCVSDIDEVWAPPDLDPDSDSHSSRALLTISHTWFTTLLYAVTCFWNNTIQALEQFKYYKSLTASVCHWQNWAHMDEMGNCWFPLEADVYKFYIYIYARMHTHTHTLWGMRMWQFSVSYCQRPDNKWRNTLKSNDCSLETIPYFFEDYLFQMTSIKFDTLL